MDRTIIALFCYKRMAKLKSCVEALQKNPECASMDVIFFSDGYRNEKDKPGVLATRAYINSVTGFRNVHKQFRDRNLTSCPNFYEGLSYLCSNYERFIVIEDDLLVTPNYIRYMLDSLDYYRSNRSVFCITGYCFPLVKEGYPYDTVMHKRFCSYGWASWSDRLLDVIWDKEQLMNVMHTSQHFKRRLDEEGLDLFRTLKKQLNGTVSAWDILMQVHVAEHGMKVVYPVVSKVCNIGFDEESTNTFGVDYLKTVTDTGELRAFNFCEADTPAPALQQQLKKPYGLRALAVRKLINTWMRLTALV